MTRPANDFRPIDDPDDAEETRLAARRAKIKHASAAYAGRTDLLELGLATCRELREAQINVNAIEGKSPDLMAVVTAKSDDLLAIEGAMDEATKDKFWDALGIPAVPDDF